tara:strand:- start:12 stop:233 length:222 start_codon:yes stop_codon:yes gene_type:complete
MGKLGTYITKLMTTALDSDQEQFVKQLAFDELKRININIEEFLIKNNKTDDSEKIAKTVKQLLQEEKDNVKDK